MIRPPFQDDEEEEVQDWNMKYDGARLIMCLLLRAEQFVRREEMLPREHVDALALHPFWEELAKFFCSADPELDTLFGDLNGRFTSLGLRSAWTGYKATGEILRKKFNELRAGYMVKMVRNCTCILEQFLFDYYIAPLFHSYTGRLLIFGQRLRRAHYLRCDQDSVGKLQGLVL